MISEIENKGREESTKVYYFYSISCMSCKKTMPIIDELVVKGHQIVKLDISRKKNQELLLALEIKFGIIGSEIPVLIDPHTGNNLLGYNPKELILKLIKGEVFKPSTLPPLPPSLNASDNEILNWKKEYSDLRH